LLGGSEKKTQQTIMIITSEMDKLKKEIE